MLATYLIHRQIQLRVINSFTLEEFVECAGREQMGGGGSEGSRKGTRREIQSPTRPPTTTTHTSNALNLGGGVRVAQETATHGTPAMELYFGV